MNKEFAVQTLNAAGKMKASAIAETFDVCLNRLTEMCPHGRELALVKTKLEEACFFAKKAIANQPENVDPLPG